MHNTETVCRRYVVGLAVVFALAAPVTGGAQELTPPVPGMAAIDGSVQQEGVGIDALVTTAVHGVGHAIHFTTHLFGRHGASTGSAGDDGNGAVTVHGGHGVDESAPTADSGKTTS